MHAENLTLQCDAYILDREAARCTHKTIETYRYALDGFVAFLESEGVENVEAITPTLIRAFLVELQHRGLKDTTQHLHARVIRSWLNWLVDEDVLDASPMRKVSMPKLEARVPAPFSPDEVQRLLAACDRHATLGARNYAMTLTLLDTGLRMTEFASLHIGELDMRSGLVTVFGKGQKQRQVRVGSKARGAILRMLWWRSDRAEADPLWEAYDIQGQPKGALSPHGVQMAVVRLGRAAHVHPCGPHRFRRTFALWCLRDGMDLHSLRLLMGHSTLAVLQRYLALAGEDVERAHIAHSPVDNLLHK